MLKLTISSKKCEFQQEKNLNKEFEHYHVKVN